MAFKHFTESKVATLVGVSYDMVPKVGNTNIYPAYLSNSHEENGQIVADVQWGKDTFVAQRFEDSRGEYWEIIR